ncbi:hypothetical protein [Phaeodactylibacter xiamenensis]|uniref:hypothetical protein n=1 Tax=Phaeodactylibacter xiamenensis TaxID=1524460 RepID=UPI0024A830E7|nr:hypothetical protein [Phaeodactylibacter xiamenensis]
MRSLLYTTSLILSLAMAWSCQQEPELIIHESSYIPPLYTQLEYRDTGQIDYSAQEFRLSLPFIGDTYNYGWYDGPVTTAEGPAMQINIAHDTNWFVTYLFGFRFWADSEEESLWTAGHLKNMFEPGRVFLFGQGPGRVDLSFAHEGRITHVDQRSRASYLEEPEGQLQIVSTEDYSYLHPIEGHIEGLLVHCTFEGKLGLYDPALTPVTEHFKTDAALTLKNGTAAFLVTYE